MPKTGIDLARVDQIVVRGRLFVIRTMRTLKSLLSYPVITQVYRCGIPRRTSTDDNHATRFTNKDTGGNRCFAWMFKNDVGVSLFTQCTPNGFAKCAAASCPFLLTCFIRPMRRDAPMFEFVADDVACGAQLLTVLAAFIIRDDGNGSRAREGWP